MFAIVTTKRICWGSMHSFAKDTLPAVEFQACSWKASARSLHSVFQIWPYCIRHDICIGAIFLKENEGGVCIHVHCRAVCAYFQQPLAYLVSVSIILVDTNTKQWSLIWILHKICKDNFPWGIEIISWCMLPETWMSFFSYQHLWSTFCLTL